MSELAIGKVFNFNTTAPAILGTEIKGAKLIAIVNYGTAIKYENILTKYRTIYPLLPSGTPNKPENCIYYIFISSLGDTIVFADQWIDLNTVEVIEHINVNIVMNNLSLTDIPRIRNALNALGFTDYAINTNQ